MELLDIRPNVADVEPRFLRATSALHLRSVVLIQHVMPVVMHAPICDPHGRVAK